MLVPCDGATAITVYHRTNIYIINSSKHRALKLPNNLLLFAIPRKYVRNVVKEIASRASCEFATLHDDPFPLVLRGHAVRLQWISSYETDKSAHDCQSASRASRKPRFPGNGNEQFKRIEMKP